MKRNNPKNGSETMAPSLAYQQQVAELAAIFMQEAEKAAQQAVRQEAPRRYRRHPGMRPLVAVGIMALLMVLASEAWGPFTPYDLGKMAAEATVGCAFCALWFL